MSIVTPALICSVVILMITDRHGIRWKWRRFRESFVPLSIRTVFWNSSFICILSDGSLYLLCMNVKKTAEWVFFPREELRAEIYKSDVNRNEHIGTCVNLRLSFFVLVVNAFRKQGSRCAGGLMELRGWLMECKLYPSTCRGPLLGRKLVQGRSAWIHVSLNECSLVKWCSINYGDWQKFNFRQVQWFYSWSLFSDQRRPLTNWHVLVKRPERDIYRLLHLI
jgi:hypothetical protein